MTRTIIDIHVLQTVPPSNLNRDDTGSPKSALYGGVRRARVSSQAWKRACRKAFDDELDRSELGERTKRLVEILGERIVAKAPQLQEQAHDLAQQTIKAAGISTKAPKKSKDGDGDNIPESEYLVFLSAQQYEHLADAAIYAATEAGSIADGLKERGVKTLIDRDHSIDIALFGRMVAEAPELNVDASTQVAHAISVHKVANEYDYYTAVDDHKDKAEETGAGMIGTVEFNSATLYRYATIDVDQLERNLGDATAARRAVEAFVRAFTLSMPSGKQNTFAGHTRPDLVLVKARDTHPMSFVGAFEKPVLPEGGGYVEAATARLAKHSDSIEDTFEEPALRSWLMTGSTTVDASAGSLGEPMKLGPMVSAIGDLVTERLAGR